MSNTDDEMREEYDVSTLKKGVRGKYASQYREGINVVVIDDDLSKAFPNSQAVNDALRKILKESDNSAA